MNRNGCVLAAVVAAAWLAGCGGSDGKSSGPSGDGRNSGGDAGSQTDGAAGSASDGAAGRDAEGDGGSGHGAGDDDAGYTGDPDEACPEDYDADAPALRLTAVEPTEPRPLADIAPGTQNAVDDGSLSYLLSMSELVGGSAAGLFGIGEPADTELTYRYSGEPAELTFSVDGESFISEGEAEVALTIPLTQGNVLSIPLKEAVLSGEFNTPERCSIGEETAEGPPSEWDAGGQMVGLLTVDDARDITVELGSRSFSLCSYMAYGLTAVALGDDPDCTEVSNWTYAPNDATASGDAAWRVSADFAATAIHLE